MQLTSLNSCSGMPECKLGLNDRVLLEAQGRATKGKAIDLDDTKFHQYVVQSSFYLFVASLILLRFRYCGLVLCLLSHSLLLLLFSPNFLFGSS